MATSLTAVVSADVTASTAADETSAMASAASEIRKENSFGDSDSFDRWASGEFDDVVGAKACMLLVKNNIAKSNEAVASIEFIAVGGYRGGEYYLVFAVYRRITSPLLLLTHCSCFWIFVVGGPRR